MNVEIGDKSLLFLFNFEMKGVTERAFFKIENTKNYKEIKKCLDEAYFKWAKKMMCNISSRLNLPLDENFENTVRQVCILGDDEKRQIIEYQKEHNNDWNDELQNHLNDIFYN